MTPTEFWADIKVSALAKDLQISRQAVYKWQKRATGVPADRAKQVSQATSQPLGAIRPDLFA